MSGVKCYNNIFQVSGSGASGPLNLVHVPSTFLPQNPFLGGNMYCSTGGDFNIYYGAKYSSLSAFRSTGNEKINGSNVGLESDPLLTGLTATPKLLYPSTNSSLNQFQITTISSAKDAGLDLSKEFGLSVGSQDFWGGSIPVNGKYDIGAHEFGAAALAEFVNNDHWFRIHPNPIFGDELSLEILRKADRISTIYLMDITGRKLPIEFPINGQNQIKMDVSQIPSGLYWLVLKSEKQRLQTTQVVIYH
jgi:hypothetical protein